MKTYIASLFVFASLAFSQPLPQSGTSLTKTTLSAAVTASATNVVVAATTGCPQSGTFNPVSNPCVLITGHEIMDVVAINGTVLTVARGAAGTIGEAHAANALAFIASTSAVKPNARFTDDLPWSDWTFYGTFAGQNSVASASITDVSGKLWYSALQIPRTTIITKACIMKGAGTATDSVVLAIWDRLGNLLGTTATAGTALSGAASIYQCIALTNAIVLAGPQTYYVGVQGNGTTAGQFAMYAAGGAPDLYPTGSQTGGTFGTVLPITSPAYTFTASVGPVMALE